MKKLILGCMALLVSTAGAQTQDRVEKKWLGQPVDFESIRQVINTYHMYNAAEDKVGSMIFGTYFENGQLVARDTSQFDDGSVYEIAEFKFDTTHFVMRSSFVDMTTSRGKIVTDLTMKGKSVKGEVDITTNGATNHISIDQTYDFDIIRSELYLLLQSVSVKAGDSLRFRALVPSSTRIAQATLTHVGEESINTEAGSFACDVLLLSTDGNMPENKIWVSQGALRQIVQFYVSAASLTIRLVAQRDSKDR